MLQGAPLGQAASAEAVRPFARKEAGRPREVALRDIRAVVGRTYRDYLRARKADPRANVAQYDSVIGKTHIAIGLGMEATRSRIPTYFMHFRDLVLRLRRALAEGREESTVKNLNRYRLLIIDRLVRHSSIIRITGRSYRIKGKMEEAGEREAANPLGDWNGKRRGRPKKTEQLDA